MRHLFAKNCHCCWLQSLVIYLCSTVLVLSNHGSLNRRDVLIGLSGLYSATTVINTKLVARAEPVTTPETKCGPPMLPDAAVPRGCCPPASDKAAKIFTPPGLDTPLKVRPALHLVDKEYIDKFTEGIRRMKALPPSDPRSFRQQAMIHCAYCYGTYEQAGLNISKHILIHESWLFLPFHRCYLYFFERILGSLIGDPTFAMPFWNWDSVGGMKMPAMYTNQRSPLFNVFRNPDHIENNKTVDLDFWNEEEHDASHENLPESEMVERNLKLMYRQMGPNGSTRESFFGKAYRAGDDPAPGLGSIENMPHNTVHDWVGDPLQPNREVMGTFYSAAWDPVFYAHHSNLDRLWTVWKTLGRRNTDFHDPDWLNASFIFYDENAELVRIKANRLFTNKNCLFAIPGFWWNKEQEGNGALSAVRIMHDWFVRTGTVREQAVRVADCLDSEKQMRYKYQDVPIEWLDKKPTVETIQTRSPQPKSNLKEAQFPLILDSPKHATVRRPKTNRSEMEKKMQEEILQINGIKLSWDSRVKFDVYVDVVNHQIAPAARVLIGSYTRLAHMHKHDEMSMGIETSVQFGLTELIDDLGINGNETIEVTLVPRHDSGKVTISGITINLSG